MTSSQGVSLLHNDKKLFPLVQSLLWAPLPLSYEASLGDTAVEYQGYSG